MLKHLIWFGLSPAPVITEHSLRCGVPPSNVKSAAYSAQRVSDGTRPSRLPVAGRLTVCYEPHWYQKSYARKVRLPLAWVDLLISGRRTAPSMVNSGAFSSASLASSSSSRCSTDSDVTRFRVSRSRAIDSCVSSVCPARASSSRSRRYCPAQCRGSPSRGLGRVKANRGAAAARRLHCTR